MRWLVGIFCLLINCTAVFADTWDDILKDLNLTKDELKFNRLDIAALNQTQLQSAYYQSLHTDPLRVPYLAKTFREAALKNASKPADLLVMTAHRIGYGLRRHLVHDTYARLQKKADDPKALLELSKNLKIKESQFQGLDPSFKKPLVILLLAVVEAVEWQKKAFRALEKAEGNKLIAKLLKERLLPPAKSGEDDDRGASAELLELIDKTDFSALFAGAFDLHFVVEKSLDKLKSAKWPTRPFSFLSRYGEVVVAAPGKNDVYQGNKNYLLLLDPDGDDTYLAGGASYGADLPVSIIVDLKGQDSYLADRKLAHLSIGQLPERKAKWIRPQFGAGFFGYGFLYDLSGNDSYKGIRQTLARGDFGVGVLVDQDGDDIYECWVQCEASAEFGLGLLLDQKGQDQYSAFQQAEGFGGPLGAALLFDQGEEKDRYIAETKQIDFPSQVDKLQNTSLSQGAACGLRADISDGHTLAGGFGGLIDGGGDNYFEAGFFAQGAAYWYGVGWLSLGAGADTLIAGKYAQAAGVHYGVGAVSDAGGDDSYTVAQELGLGHGHDYGLGFFIDENGNDQYQAPNFALGCGSAQGMGFFWDRRGQDLYRSQEKEILGCTSLRVDLPTSRLVSLTLGVFLDSDGENEFQTPTLRGKKKDFKWTQLVLELPENFPPQKRVHLKALGRVAQDSKLVDPL